jgi:prepilin-type N-terminal cleavage/methylation domain-containing protein
VQKQFISRKGVAGFTLVEVMIVVILVGLTSLLTAPRIATALATNNTRSARSNAIALYTQARSAATATGRVTTLTFIGNVALITATPRLSGAGTLDTIGKPQNFRQIYGVSVTGTPAAALSVDPRGLGNSSSTTIYFQRGGYTDSIRVTGFGRLVK